jgi:hypothetical protein
LFGRVLAGSVQIGRGLVEAAHFDEGRSPTHQAEEIGADSEQLPAEAQVLRAKSDALFRKPHGLLQAPRPAEGVTIGCDYRHSQRIARPLGKAECFQGMLVVRPQIAGSTLGVSVQVEQEREQSHIARLLGERLALGEDGVDLRAPDPPERAEDPAARFHTQRRRLRRHGGVGEQRTHLVPAP